MPVIINGTTGISGVDGSAGTPAFQGSDTNTGIRFGTDIVSLVTGGSDRLYIDSSGRLGVGTTSPAWLLDLLGSAPRIRVKDSSTGAAFHHLENNSGNFFLGIDNSTGGSLSAGNYARLLWSQGAYPLVFGTNDTQRAQIDSSGRLLVGTSSTATAGNSQYSLLQVKGGSGLTSAVLSLTRAQAAASISSGSGIGSIAFGDEVGNPYAYIACESDAASGAGDYPGRLVFSTTADGASSPTEAMRINNQRELLIGTTTRTANGGVLQVSNGITFPATQSACSNANTLDDYEEGTWTPIATPGTGSGQTTSVRGEYTKIGNQVTLWGEVIVTGVGTAASFMQITGLPFNVVANDRAVGVTRDRGTQNNPMGSVYSPQNDRLILVKYDGTTPWTATTYWMFSVSYQV